MFLAKEKWPYRAVVHLNGRHPYLTSHDLDYPTRDVELTVPATSWSDAAKVAIEGVRGLNYWSASVKSLERVEA